MRPRAIITILALVAAGCASARQQQPIVEGQRAEAALATAKHGAASSGQAAVYLRSAEATMQEARSLEEKGDRVQAWNKYARARADADLAAALAERDTVGGLEP